MWSIQRYESIRRACLSVLGYPALLYVVRSICQPKELDSAGTSEGMGRSVQLLLLCTNLNISGNHRNRSHHTYARYAVKTTFCPWSLLVSCCSYLLLRKMLFGACSHRPGLPRRHEHRGAEGRAGSIAPPSDGQRRPRTSVRKGMYVRLASNGKQI